MTIRRYGVSEARRPHCCHGCGRWISPGDTYYWESWVEGRVFRRAVECFTCSTDGPPSRFDVIDHADNYNATEGAEERVISAANEAMY